MVASMSTKFMRCEITGNPAGTDTRMTGAACGCKSCSVLPICQQDKFIEIFDSLAARQEPLGEEFERVWMDSIDELYTA